MNSIQHRCPSTVARALAATAFAAAMALAVAPVFAAGDARVEKHIAAMHANLRITAAEEEQWSKVAEAMRDNASRMDEQNAKRTTNAKTMTALDDLASYGDSVETHATEIRRFAAAFEPLYASMSETQKADADALFRHGERKHRPGAKK